MTATQFRWFLAIVVVISLAITVIYLRYSYMGSHDRYDFWKDEYQTMIEGGEWVPEKLVGKDT